MKKNQVLIGPSILSADFARLAEEIQEVERAGADVIHVDVMDGHFVPNLTIGPVVIQGIRKATKLPLDVHLMIDQPERYIDEFRSAGSDWITIHVEASRDVAATLRHIKDTKAKAGLSIRPKTPVEELKPYLSDVDLILIMSVEPGFGGQSFMPETMEKVRYLKSNFKGILSVDGGINAETASVALKAGTNLLVAGTAVFGQKDRKAAIESLRRA